MCRCGQWKDGPLVFFPIPFMCREKSRKNGCIDIDFFFSSHQRAFLWEKLHLPQLEQWAAEWALSKWELKHDEKDTDWEQHGFNLNKSLPCFSSIQAFSFWIFERGYRPFRSHTLVQTALLVLNMLEKKRFAPFNLFPLCCMQHVAFQSKLVSINEQDRLTVWCRNAED